MNLIPAALTIAGAALVAPALTGWSAASAPELDGSFDASTIAALAANGIEQASQSTDEAAGDLDAAEASRIAERALGGAPYAAVLAPFTDHNQVDDSGTSVLTSARAWQVVLNGTRLPDGTVGRAWIAVDTATGDILSAEPLVDQGTP